MNKVAVVFWSGTGNTEALGNAVAKACEGQIFEADAFDAAKVDAFDAIAFGCPSMGAEELGNSTFEPMFSACKAKLKDKRIALFGSYGWGDGEWMRTWEEDCDSVGANRVCDSVICCETPEDDALSACENLGKALLNA